MTENIKKQIVYLEDKNYLKVTCVENVISLTETEAGVMVNGEVLVIKGNNIKAEKLLVETGELVLVGNFNQIKFEEKKQKQSLLKRIFK